MSFAIEVPGEANPLNAAQVYHALQAAGSSQPLQIQSGAKQLQSWESHRGYYPLLQTVYCDRSLPLEVRYLAIIQLKNGIDRYWRRTAVNAISADDKAQIRPRLLESGLAEDQPALALQNALVVAKVLRIDYPTAWSDVFATLLGMLREAQGRPLHLRRCMVILHHAVKELASARLARSQSSLRAIAPEVVHLLRNVYDENVSAWLSFMDASPEQSSSLQDALSTSLSALKILRRLLIAGFEYPNHSSEVCDMWRRSQEQLRRFVTLISLATDTSIAHLLEAHVLQLSKLHLSMVETHPAAFVLLPYSIELCQAYHDLVTDLARGFQNDGNSSQHSSSVGSEHEAVSMMDKLCIKALTLLRNCIKLVHSPAHTFKYRSPEIKAEQQHARSRMDAELLTTSFVTHIAGMLVEHFFVLRPRDLHNWDDSEEGDSEGNGYQDYDIRPCAEKLFTDLVIAYKQLLKGPLLQLFQDLAPLRPEEDVLKRDAVYTALGLAAPVMFEDFDFDTLLVSTLVKDVLSEGPTAKVLRRRIAILISKWVTVRVADANRPLIYQIFKHLLDATNRHNDLIVRITAGQHLKDVIDDMAFDVQAFLPFAADILSLLIGLINEVKSTDTKLAIIETMRATAARLDQSILPFADAMVNVLPGIWEASGDEHLLKQGIMTLMSTIIASMHEKADRYHGLVLPLIKSAVEPGSELQVYLLEDAIDLWAMVLLQTTAPASAQLVELVEYIPALLDMGSDSLRIVIGILNSYVLLAPEAILQNETRKAIIRRLAQLLQKPKREVAGLVTSVLEDLIRKASSLGGSAGLGLLIQDLHECGFLRMLLAGVQDAWAAHETTGPDRRYPELDDVVETDFFTILARIALADPVLFWGVISSFGEAGEVWRWLSTEWFRHFDSMANIERQKLSCLALTRLLELDRANIGYILGRLQDYMTMWTTVTSEMSSGRDDGGDNLVWQPDEAARDDIPEDARKRLHALSDEVHRIHTFAFVKERLQNVVVAIGGDDVFHQEWLINVDKDVLSAFQTLPSPP